MRCGRMKNCWKNAKYWCVCENDKLWEVGEWNIVERMQNMCINIKMIKMWENKAERLQNICV